MFKCNTKEKVKIRSIKTYEKAEKHTSPAFTVITCGVNPTPADPARRNLHEIIIMSI